MRGDRQAQGSRNRLSRGQVFRHDADSWARLQPENKTALRHDRGQFPFSRFFYASTGAGSISLNRISSAMLCPQR